MGSRILKLLMHNRDFLPFLIIECIPYMSEPYMDTIIITMEVYHNYNARSGWWFF